MTQTKAELLQTRHQGDIRLGDADSTHYVGLKAPATVSSNLVWTLPATDGSSNQFLKTDGSGNLSWATDSATDSTKMPLAGGTFTGNTIYNDGVRAQFGTGNDLNIYHTSNINYIEVPNAATGDLKIETLGAKSIHIRAGDNATGAHNSIICNSDASVELYEDGLKVFETAEYGAIVKRTTGGSTVLEVIGCEGNNAEINLKADDGDDNADRWKLKSGTSGNFSIGNYSTGSWVDGLTLDGSNNATLAGGLTVDTNTLHVDATNNKVGIGLTSPETQLEVLGSVWTKRSTADQWGEQFRGRKDRAGSKVEDNDDILTLLAQGYDGSAYRDVAKIEYEIDGATGSSDMPGRLVFSTTADGGSSSTERMRINSSGNIGIGTTSPNVYANQTTLTINGTDNARLDLEVGGTLRGSIWTNSGGIGIDAGANEISLYSGSAERFKVGNSGQFGIGGATYGTSGQVLTSGGASAAPTWADAAGGGFSNIVRITSTNSSWSIPSGATTIKVYVVGGGGGGGGNPGTVSYTHHRAHET